MKLQRIFPFLHSFGLLLIIVCTGCAPAYRSYPGCHVKCRYCAPRPLPYEQYQPCVCHSAPGDSYLYSAPDRTTQATAEQPPD